MNTSGASAISGSAASRGTAKGCGSREIDRRRPMTEQGRNAPLWRVLRAVCQGAKEVESIAQRSQLSVSATRTCLRRLRDAGWIFAVPAKAKRAGKRGAVKGQAVKRYHAEVECLLLDIWKAEPDGNQPEGWPFPKKAPSSPRTSSVLSRAV